MGGAGVIAWLLVLLCGGAGAYCAGRLCLRRAAPAAHRAADATEAVMGLGMAAMAAGLGTPTGIGVAVYGSAALASLVLAALATGHRAHHAYHLVGHGTMVYMTVAMAASPRAEGGGSGGMAGMGAMPVRGVPVVTGALLLACVLVSVAAGLRLIPPEPTAPDPTAPGPTALGPTAPRPTIPGPGTPGPTPPRLPIPGRITPRPTTPRPTAPRPTTPSSTAPGVIGAGLVGWVGAGFGGTGSLWRAPALPDACRVVMGLCMATMLALL